MEPRNIGIIVWLNGHTEARFIGEDPTSNDVLVVPRRISVTDKKNYKRWISSWRLQIQKDQLELGRGKTIGRTSPDFVSALCEWSRGNYMLVEGGEIAESISPTELGELTDYLYRELVSDPEDNQGVERESNRLKTTATHALKSSGISARTDFQSDWPGTLNLHGVQKIFDFDYSLGPTGQPYSLYHRVILSHQKTFDSVVLNFDAFKRTKQFPTERLCALVVDDAKMLITAQHRENRLIIGKIATVVNVADEETARQKLSEISQLNGHPSP
jgi:hypothetical protein